jgi:hypothetical protein
MSIEGFRILAQSEAHGSLSFTFEFSVGSRTVLNTEITFISDVSQRGSPLSKSFPVSAAFSQETRDWQVFVAAEIRNFWLAELLPYDDQTNFSAFEVSCSVPDEELTFLIPVFCAGGGESARMKLMPV